MPSDGLTMTIRERLEDFLYYLINSALKISFEVFGFVYGLFRH